MHCRSKESLYVTPGVREMAVTAKPVSAERAGRLRPGETLGFPRAVGHVMGSRQERAGQSQGSRVCFDAQTSATLAVTGRHHPTVHKTPENEAGGNFSTKPSGRFAVHLSPLRGRSRKFWDSVLRQEIKSLKANSFLTCKVATMSPAPAPPPPGPPVHGCWRRVRTEEASHVPGWAAQACPEVIFHVPCEIRGTERVRDPQREGEPDLQQAGTWARRGPAATAG